MYSKPAYCGMTGLDCYSLIGGWTLGSIGSCLPDDYGYRIGKSGFKYVVLQVNFS